MRIIEELKFGFKDCLNFSSRVPRSTFVFWVIGKHLIFLFGYFLALFIEHLFYVNNPHIQNLNVTSLVLWILTLFLLLPSTSMAVKRLHDIGMSAWWLLFSCALFFGWSFVWGFVWGFCPCFSYWTYRF